MGTREGREVGNNQGVGGELEWGQENGGCDRGGVGVELKGEREVQGGPKERRIRIRRR